MDRIIDYFHKNYYPDMNVEDVASAMTDPAIQESALSHIQQMHYPDMSVEEIAGNVKPRQPIVVTNPNDPRLRAYNDSNTLYQTGEKNKADKIAMINALDINKNLHLNIYSTDEPLNSRAWVDKNNKTKISPTGVTLSGPHIFLNDEKSTTYYQNNKGESNELSKYLNGKLQTPVFTYKKPVQPVIYQKPKQENVKREPIIKTSAIPKGTPKDMIRTDGTLKGKGFLGMMRNAKKGKQSSELSIGIDVEGKPALIPTMIPTLNQEELNHLLNNKYNPQARTGIDEAISQKAINFAYERKAKGLPYFATKEEEGKFKIQPTAKPTPAKPTPAKNQYTSAKKTYQGREFMETTGLRPGLYYPEEVEAAKAAQMKTKRRAF